MFFLKTKNLKLKTDRGLVSGFTLIETMVAISIMLMAITSPLVLAKQGMVSARQARNSITAFYMAQDAIEYIRNVRDTNLLSEQSWLTNLAPCLNGNYCIVDTLNDDFSTAFSSCEVGGCPVINKTVDVNGDFDFYDYDTGYPSSGFTRNVKLVTVNTDEVRVEVEITWDNGRRSFFVSESLNKLVE